MTTQDGQKDSQSRSADQSAQGLKVRLSHAPSSIEAVTGTLYATQIVRGQRDAHPIRLARAGRVEGV